MNQFMLAAIEEAKAGVREQHGGPFGAVIVYQNQIIARGHNEVLLNQDPTCHGEMMAIRRAAQVLKSFNLAECEIYTTAEPCPMCMAAILWARISKIYYGCNRLDTAEIGFDDQYFYEMLANDSKRNALMENIEREGCLEVFKFWSELEGKTIY